MAKTQMQLANRAWRTETKALGWDKEFCNRKTWKAFCRCNAIITVYERKISGEPKFLDQHEANYHVAEELTYWTP